MHRCHNLRQVYLDEIDRWEWIKELTKNRAMSICRCYIIRLWTLAAARWEWKCVSEGQNLNYLKYLTYLIHVNSNICVKVSELKSTNVKATRNKSFIFRLDGKGKTPSEIKGQRYSKCIGIHSEEAYWLWGSIGFKELDTKPKLFTPTKKVAAASKRFLTEGSTLSRNIPVLNDRRVCMPVPNGIYEYGVVAWSSNLTTNN